MNGYQAAWEQSFSVFDGPGLAMTFIYECKEDDFRDSLCGPGSQRSQQAGWAYGGDVEDFAYEKKSDKFFWNFQWHFSAQGYAGTWTTPNRTSKRYVCDGDWESDPDSRPAPCVFVAQEGDDSIKTPDASGGAVDAVNAVS